MTLCELTRDDDSTVSTQWFEVCGVDDLVLNSGVCAMVNGCQVALFCVAASAELNTQSVQLFAVGNDDPIGKAAVLYRGIVGSVDDHFVVASPLYKQRYHLSTGDCLDNPDIAIPTYPAKIENGRVMLKMGEGV
ncbi:nitrite reductase small subunit NirD [Alteromonas oceanisediminis]|uniref:nitrite reductase small subunit NirD n=1 Tax=Alteromonas oceanisediminis TaxID=2836180 RepID=UPI001BDA3DCA|nr:nitrite reductase small subunit NirD [Alteromonas oceanisediminis]MBT0586031.1 nitrite reductase small subunit NirD [Alteromonas oceanisediminis]